LIHNALTRISNSHPLSEIKETITQRVSGYKSVAKEGARGPGMLAERCHALF